MHAHAHVHMHTYYMQAPSMHAHATKVVISNPPSDGFSEGI